MRTHRSAGRAAAAFSLIFTAVAFCPGTAVASDADATVSIVNRYNAWTEDLSTLTCGGKAVIGAAGEKDRTFRFSMVLARPGNVRLQGRWGNLTTLFDLAATPGAWTLLLPRNREVVRSPTGDAAAGLLLPPGDLFACLMPKPVSTSRLLSKGAHGMEAGSLRLVLPPEDGTGSLHRVLWLDPQTGSLKRMELRRESMLEPVLLVVNYSDHKGAGEDPAFPHSISIAAPGESWARFTFTSAKVNREIDPRRFTILVPRGVKEVEPADIDPDFLPEDSESGK